MLQSLREKTQGWPAKIIFGVLIFVFSFFGIEGYFQSRVETYVAKVGKQEVSQQDFQNRLNRLRQQLTQQQGAKYDPTYLERPEVKQRVLDGMIDRLLLRDASDKMGLTVSKQALRAKIASYGAFQVDGKFDPGTYRAVLASQGMSPLGFQKEVQSQMETELLPDLIKDTSVATDADVNGFLTLLMQTRDIRYATLPRPALTDTKVDDKTVADYYDKHKADFMTPEQVSVNYIELKASDMPVTSKPDEATLKARYEKEKQRFVKPEQRLVSHILINVPANATPAQQKAALAKAESIDKQANPADFAKLAKKYSDDLGSKRGGGQLGWIERGVTNKAFEDALFSMKKGEISKPVLSPEGYHIIWLQNVRSGDVKPFAEVRDQLAQEVEKTDRERAYSDLASKLTDKVYADPTALAPIAQELGLKLQHTGLFSRDGDKTGLAANSKVVKAAFSSDVLKDGNTSDPIDMGNNDIVVVHVDQHVQAKAKPLTEVAGVIRQKILDARVEAEARKQAESLFAQVNKGGNLDAVVGKAMVSVQPVKGLKRNQQGVPAPIIKQVFTMPHPASGKPTYSMVTLSGGSYALVELDAVHPGDISKLPEMQLKMLHAQLAQGNAVEAANEFVKVLRSTATIKIAKERM